MDEEEEDEVDDDDDDNCCEVLSFLGASCRWSSRFCISRKKALAASDKSPSPGELIG